MTDGYAALTDKEKETLRLIVRGHDAKSMARHLGLSVHTINERLRDARRKLAVSSSREAARLVLDHEGADPESSTDKQIGEATAAPSPADPDGPEDGTGHRRRVRAIAGVAIMSVIIAIAAATLLPQAAPPPVEANATSSSRAIEVQASARHFLTLIDQGKWPESYALTTDSFHKSNTLQVWTQVSEQVRPPLGPVVARTLLSHENVPTPPAGHEIVRFRTSFTNKPNAIETVSLERAGNGWRVAGVTIE
jgi:DNA-binding CsgD family transcriptional regulator